MVDRIAPELMRDYKTAGINGFGPGACPGTGSWNQLYKPEDSLDEIRLQTEAFVVGERYYLERGVLTA